MTPVLIKEFTIILPILLHHNLKLHRNKYPFNFKHLTIVRRKKVLNILIKQLISLRWLKYQIRNLILLIKLSSFARFLNLIVLILVGQSCMPNRLKSIVKSRDYSPGYLKRGRKKILRQIPPLQRLKYLIPFRSKYLNTVKYLVFSIFLLLCLIKTPQYPHIFKFYPLKVP